MTPNLKQCLLSILQRGITEARTSALCGDVRRTADLLDALDDIPRHLSAWNEDSERGVTEQLSAFQRAHPDHDTDYVGLLAERWSAP
jgi:hypothetical protein